ncbi:MAG: Membrane-associated phospholipid phosphatase [Ignavibacteria bacterium]|nr:Membrane-associated phospholipid phosphatase [Ignavibacteria bacterium]
MLQYLVLIDREIFYFFNHTMSNYLFDIFFPFITNSKNWMPVYILMFLWLFIKGGKNGRICGITLLLTAVVSDQTSSHLLKELIGRIRPCHVLPDVHLLVPCGGGKSLPSSHAVNNFAAAYVLTYYYKNLRILFYTIATLVALSRVFVGVHYPADIAFGALWGLLIGFLMVYTVNKTWQYFIKLKEQKTKNQQIN